jgi:hypothetical protein
VIEIATVNDTKMWRMRDQALKRRENPKKIAKTKDDKKSENRLAAKKPERRENQDSQGK